ncbi:hypothetical protein [Blastopirellula retiformator]|uniref:hypothetical protein n=1 Tax=Blastopirellula retiformator TaxID=2527970 RepID=UPI0011B3E728|nr:hypothetical protein [Blastopirellula retiformator]
MAKIRQIRLAVFFHGLCRISRRRRPIEPVVGSPPATLPRAQKGSRAKVNAEADRRANALRQCPRRQVIHSAIQRASDSWEDDVDEVAS